MPKRRTRRSPAGRAARTLFTLPLACAGGWIAYSNLFVPHDLTLPKAIEGDRQTFTSETGGTTSYYAAREASGRPLVLVHSINAAASAYEMRPLFERYRAARPVYAPDLPGFGFSDRSDRLYTPQTYVAALLEFLDEVVGEPADVVALSLGGEFAARAALAEPDHFRSLALISPSGFGETRGDRGASGERAYRWLSFPLWARPFYDLLTTRASIRWFLSLSFEGAVDTGLADYDYLTAHQPGAENAPLYFVSGQLFTPQVRTQVYAQLRRPTLVLYDRDSFVSFEMLPGFVGEHGNWRMVRIAPTKGLPQFEQPAETTRSLDQFWQSIEGE